MGRPREANAMASTERSRKYHLDPDNCLAANKKKRDPRKLKALTNPLNEDELEKKKMAGRLRKAASHMNQSRQKKVGLKLKDRNRKRKNIESDIENSTEHVQKHCALKVKLDFKNKKQKIDGVAKKLDIYLSKLSPASKVKAISQLCNETLSLYLQHQNLAFHKSYPMKLKIHW